MVISTQNVRANLSYILVDKMKYYLIKDNARHDLISQGRQKGMYIIRRALRYVVYNSQGIHTYTTYAHPTKFCMKMHNFVGSEIKLLLLWHNLYLKAKLKAKI